ncbi:MAG: hypothetical protein J6N93_05695 [Clostridia bacterium]|nr:hypothetical protein [Clostridia bacterium]
MSYKCPICGGNVDISACSNTSALYYYRCENGCGFFAPNLEFNEKTDEISYFNYSYSRNKLKSYLFYHKSDLRPILLSQEEFSKIGTNGFVKIYNLTPEMVENWYPKTFAEKIDYILLYLAKKTDYLGQQIIIRADEISRLFFQKNELNSGNNNDWLNEAKFIFDFLSERYLIKYHELVGPLGTHLAMLVRGTFNHIQVSLTTNAFDIIEPIQRDENKNKNVFVSMAFNKGTENTREAIRQGIIGAGYSPEFIDEIIHNRQIVPEMLRLIRESRFLILDISEPNFGAYYEAGYAAGLGKEVIVCCKKEIFEKKDFICPNLESVKEYDKESLSKKDCQYYSKALRPHFDIAQKQTLVWEDEGDLTKKLTEWIKFLFDKN